MFASFAAGSIVVYPLDLGGVILRLVPLNLVFEHAQGAPTKYYRSGLHIEDHGGLSRALT